MRRFRNHCMTTDHRERQEKGSWFYEVTDLGYNYRLTDISALVSASSTCSRVDEATTGDRAAYEAFRSVDG